MKSEEYFRHLDHIKKELDKILDIIDTRSQTMIDRTTQDLIFIINRYRKFNALPLYEVKS